MVYLSIRPVSRLIQPCEPRNGMSIAPRVLAWFRSFRPSLYKAFVPALALGVLLNHLSAPPQDRSGFSIVKAWQTLARRR